MVICNVCTAGLTSKTPGLKCAGSCSLFYHGKCVGMSKQSVVDLQLPGASWLCPECRLVENKGRSSVVVSPGVKEDMDPPTSALTLKIVQKTQDDISNLNKKQREIIHSVSFCSDQISSFQMIINKVNDKLDIIERLTQENISLKKEVINLTNRVESLEQQLKSNNLEILGVPEKSNEKLPVILQKISENIEFPISSGDVDALFRSNTSIIGKSRPIIVKFNRKVARDEFLSAARMKRKSNRTSSPGLKIDNISDQLFINEHLTRYNKILLNKAKEYARKNNYKYIWVREGTIYARKDDKAKVFRILNLTWKN